MSSITLRHYNVTLGYRTSEFDRRMRTIKHNLRTHFSRRSFKRQLRAFLSRGR